jgi:hypothetical protein
MKDCAYKHESEYGGESVMGKKEEAKYPSFELWSPEAVGAVFGKAKLTAGAQMDIPMRLRIRSVTNDMKDGNRSVTVEIVAVGKPSDMEEGEDDTEEES